MSTYYENDRRGASTRNRRRDDDYYDDEVYTNTRDNQRSTTTALVRRRDDSPESVEEVRRDFSPGGGGYYRETITRKSGIRPAGRARSYENDRYDDDRSYASTRRDNYRRDDDRRSVAAAARRSRYSNSSSSRSRTPPKKRERRKSMPEEALEALGLTGVVAAITGKKNRSRSSSRDRRSRGGRDRSRSKSHGREQLIQAFKAAALAGAGAAFAARHDAGGWQGEKGKRVLTAAITAGGANGLINQYKDPEKHKLRDTIGSAAAGLAADRLVNGPNSRAGSPNGRSQSRGRGGDLLAGGTLAATAKKVTDSFRSRSRSRGRNSRSPSYDSYMDESPDRRRRSRSRSVAGRALSKIGLSSAADKVDPAGARDRDRSRSRSRGPSRRRSRSRSGYADDDDDSYYDDPRRQSSTYQPPYDNRGSIYGDNREVGPQSRPRSLSRTRSVGAGGGDSQLIPRPNSVGPGGHKFVPPPPDYTLDYGPRHTGDPETDTDSDLGSSSEDEQRHKKGRKSLLITGGLATVATIHAGKSIYSTVEKRQARKHAVRDGLMSKEEAQKHKTRDRLQDVASVGLAGLGVKGAYDEWKEMKEKQEEWNETKEKVVRHRKKRHARREKARLADKMHGYSSSAPTLSDPFYGDSGYDDEGRQHVYHGNQGPYMSGGAGLASRHGGYDNGPSPTANGGQTQYFDGNPYGSIAGGGGYQGHGQQYPQQQQNYGQGQGQGGYYGNGYENINGASTFPPPPQQGGTGYPPPPMG